MPYQATLSNSALLVPDSFLFFFFKDIQNSLIVLLSTMWFCVCTSKRKNFSQRDRGNPNFNYYTQSKRWWIFFIIANSILIHRLITIRFPTFSDLISSSYPPAYNNTVFHLFRPYFFDLFPIIWSVGRCVTSLLNQYLLYISSAIKNDLRQT